MNGASNPSTTQPGIGGAVGMTSQYPFAIGSVVKERYRIEREIGKGGFGIVYEATDLCAGGTRVAVKTLKHNLDDYEMAAKRFKREIKLCQSIKNVHAVKIFDDGMAEDGTLFYVMEYLEGCGLDSLIEKREKFTFRETKSILVQVLEALAEAHQKGIIHRDLKPANIWLTERSTRDNTRSFDVKVLDFGIAKAIDKNAGEDKLTQTGTWMGSPAYMSPEHLTGREVTPSSDIFAIGLIAIEMITNRPAVEGDTPMDIAMEIMSPNGIYIEEWMLDTSFGEVLAKSVQKLPSERYKNAQELYELFVEMDDDELRNEFNEAKLRRKMRTRTSPVISMNMAQQSIPSVEGVQAQKSQGSLQTLLVVGIVFIILIIIIFLLIGMVNTIMDMTEGDEDKVAFGPTETAFMRGVSNGYFGAYEQFRGAVSITTTPNDVKVLRASDGKLLGTTPLNLSLIWARYNDVNAEPFKLKFQAEGYKELEFSLPINNNATSHHVTLERGRGRGGMNGRPDGEFGGRGNRGGMPDGDLQQDNKVEQKADSVGKSAADREAEKAAAQKNAAKAAQKKAAERAAEKAAAEKAAAEKAAAEKAAAEKAAAEKAAATKERASKANSVAAARAAKEQAAKEKAAKTKANAAKKAEEAKKKSSWSVADF